VAIRSALQATHPVAAAATSSQALMALTRTWQGEPWTSSAALTVATSVYLVEATSLTASTSSVVATTRTSLLRTLGPTSLQTIRSLSSSLRRPMAIRVAVLVAAAAPVVTSLVVAAAPVVTSLVAVTPPVVTSLVAVVVAASTTTPRKAPCSGAVT